MGKESLFPTGVAERRGDEPGITGSLFASLFATKRDKPPKNKAHKKAGRADRERKSDLKDTKPWIQPGSALSIDLLIS